MEMCLQENDRGSYLFMAEPLILLSLISFLIKCYNNHLSKTVGKVYSMSLFLSLAGESLHLDNPKVVDIPNYLFLPVAKRKG